MLLEDFLPSSYKGPEKRKQSKGRITGRLKNLNSSGDELTEHLPLTYFTSLDLYSVSVIDTDQINCFAGEGNAHL